MSEELKQLNERFEKLSEQIKGLEKKFERKPDKLGWDDIAQEIIGALTFALPFLFTQEIWDIAKSLTMERAVGILILTLSIAYLFIAKAKVSNIEREELFHIPKRLLTVVLISYLTSAGLIYLYGINRLAEFSLTQYISATIIISTFAVIGAIAVDMVK